MNKTDFIDALNTMSVNPKVSVGTEFYNDMVESINDKDQLKHLLTFIDKNLHLFESRKIPLILNYLLNWTTKALFIQKNKSRLSDTSSGFYRELYKAYLLTEVKRVSDSNMMKSSTREITTRSNEDPY